MVPVWFCVAGKSAAKRKTPMIAAERGSSILAILFLVIGFALIPTEAARMAFDEIAQGLAWLARPLLALSTPDIRLDGVVLRSAAEGHAVEVTTICDGHGIIVAWAALLATLTRSWRTGVMALLIGFLTIQALNVLRIVVLFELISAGESLFEIAHLYVFPLLTAAVVVVLYCVLAGKPLALRFSVALILVSAIWFPLRDDIANAVMLPIAQGWPLIFGNAPFAGATVVGDALDVALAEGGRFAIYPSDFAIAVPVLLATLAVAPPRWALLALALGLMVAGFLLGLHTMAWPRLAAAVPSGDPRLASQTVVSVAHLAQNVAVHFMLLVPPTILIAYKPAHE